MNVIIDFKVELPLSTAAFASSKFLCWARLPAKICKEMKSEQKVHCSYSR